MGHDLRSALLQALGSGLADTEIPGFVANRVATFDPTTCSSCALFNYCRRELRASPEPGDLLVELDVAPSRDGQWSGWWTVTGSAQSPGWQLRTFADPQAPTTRLAVMGLLGEALDGAMADGHGAVHIVGPDGPTRDVLVSTADSHRVFEARP